MAKKNTAIQDFLVDIRKKKRDLVNLSKTTISVGWVDGSKAHQKALSSLNAKNKKGKAKFKYDTSMALIAATLNYGRAAKSGKGGYPAIPARPFMDVLVNDHSDKIQKIFSLCMDDLIKGKITLQAAKDKIGVVALGQLRVAMGDSSKYERLSPATLRRRVNKEGAKPLIDTGTLRNSSDYFIK